MFAVIINDDRVLSTWEHVEDAITARDEYLADGDSSREEVMICERIQDDLDGSLFWNPIA